MQNISGRLHLYSFSGFLWNVFVVQGW